MPLRSRWTMCAGGLLIALLAAVLLRSPPTPAAPAPLPWNPTTIEPLRHRAYTEKIPDTKVAFDMVAIAGGTSVRGSQVGEPGRAEDEGPAHLVTVRPFWMGRTEVTWDEYNAYRQGRAPSQADNEAALQKDADAITRPTPAYPDETRGFGRQGYPVVGISHHAAMEYCRWLSKGTGKAYRLPTEAEWEWAARAGTTTPYFFGDEKKLAEYAWYEANANDTTHPVGKKKANPWGLHDIYGNVSEWCLDSYRRDAYAAYSLRKRALMPFVPPGKNRYPHVVRGGSWADEASKCRSAARMASEKAWNRMDPDRPQSVWWVWNAEFVGFRVVRAVEEQHTLRGVRSGVTRKSE